MHPASATAAASDDAAASAHAAVAWIAPALGAREWNRQALRTLRQEAARSADTHLLRLDFAGFPGIDFYFKDDAPAWLAARGIDPRPQLAALRATVAPPAHGDSPRTSAA